MPKVTIPTIAVPGTKLKAEDFNKALYSPTHRLAESKSLEAINGHLDSVNLGESLTEYPDYRKREAQLPLNTIRRGALARGNTASGVTSLHFSKKLWQGMFVGENPLALPGCGVNIFVPSGGTILLTWQVSIGNDGVDYDGNGPDGYDVPGTLDGKSSNKAQERTFLYLMQDTGSGLEKVPSHVFEHQANKGIYHDFAPDPAMGRTWSGHKIIQITNEEDFGWHDYCIGIWSSASNTMVRIRNMKYIWFNKQS